ncbi:MAG: glycosyltransferase family 39 protein [bacterium]
MRVKVCLMVIILLGILLRVINITNPLLDRAGWRQTDTAAIARNFYYNNFNIFYPQIDWGGNSSGYVETEFQLFPFIAALLYKITGVQEWIGRLLAIFFSVGSMWLIYRLSKKYLGIKTALFSTIFFAICPLNIYYSRTFMPESTMSFFSIAFIYYFSQWLDNEKWANFLLTGLCGILALLIKIPTLYLGLPILYLAYIKYNKSLFIKWKLWLLAGIILLPTILWYYHAHQIFKEYSLTFGIWDIGQDKWGNIQIWTDKKFYITLFHRFKGEVLTPIGLCLFLFGIILKVRQKEEFLFHFWLIGIIIYFFVVAAGNMEHNYYQLPLVSVASIFIGKSLILFINKKLLYEKVIGWIIITIAFLSISLFSYKAIKSFYFWSRPIYFAGKSVDKLVEKDILIIVSYDTHHGPELLYYCKRKGWYIKFSDINPQIVETYRRQGAKYLVIAFERFHVDAFLMKYNNLDFLRNDYRFIKSSKRNFIIFDLRSNTKLH